MLSTTNNPLVKFSPPSDVPGGSDNPLRSLSCRPSLARSLPRTGSKETSRSSVRYPGGSSLWRFDVGVYAVSGRGVVVDTVAMDADATMVVMSLRLAT